MSEVIRKIEVKAYVVPDSGTPTCCLDYQKGEVCKFMGLRKMGTQPHCMASNVDLHSRYRSYLTPHDDCIVWGD
jgi:hypothetical protein